MGMINPLSAASISIQWRPSISVFPSASGPVWPAWLGRGPWSSRCRNQGVPGGWSLDLDMTWPIQVQNINGHDSGTDWLEVPTIYKAYFLGLCKGISQQNMAWKMVQYLHFRILKFPLNRSRFPKSWGYPNKSLGGLFPWENPIKIYDAMGDSPMIWETSICHIGNTLWLW